MRIARRLLLWLSLVPALSYADTSRVINGKGLEDSDTAALNVNFDQIDTELGNVVHKTSTETIRGYKYFSNNVTASTVTVTGTVSASSATISNFTVSAFTLGPNPMMIVRDEEPSGTGAGGFTSGAYRTRVLNTVSTNTISGASLSSNQITLPPGTYYVSFSAPAWKVNGHQTKFVSVSGGTISIFGETAYTSNADHSMTRSRGSGVFTITSSSVAELQHKCFTTNATNGLGTQISGDVEVYAVVEIWKIR